MSEIAPLTAVQDRIKEKIKAEFVELMPDDLWSGLVQSVVSDFISTKNQRGYDQEAPIKKLMREALETEAKQHIATQLSKFTAEWDGYGNKIVTASVKKIVEENFEELLKAVQLGMVEATVGTAINHIRQNINY